MATDVQFVLHLPLAAEAEVPDPLYKVVTMPITPRATDEVLVAATTGFYGRISWVRYVNNLKPEVHLQYNWEIFNDDYELTNVVAVHEDLLENNDWSTTSPWAV